MYEELHDIPGLIRYAKGCADREANACQRITYLDKCFGTPKRKGSGKLSATLAKTIEDLTSVREKMTRSEELLERACRQDKGRRLWGHAPEIVRQDICSSGGPQVLI